MAEQDRTAKYQLWAAIAANILTILALLLVFFQNIQLVSQTTISTDSLKASGITNELQYNLAVMQRLDDVLVMIADDPQCYAYVWGTTATKPQDNSKPIQCGDSLIDILSMSLKAVDRLPCFSQNGQDWESYTIYVMSNSKNLRERVLTHQDWWPEVTPYAQPGAGPKASHSNNCTPPAPI